MKIIENKKLFGKINLIDILIVIVFLVAALVVYKVLFEKPFALPPICIYSIAKNKINKHCKMSCLNLFYLIQLQLIQ